MKPIPFIVAVAVCCNSCLFRAIGQDFIAGDEIEALTETKLSFYDKVVRSAQAGEKLRVIAFQNGLVYVQGIGPDGKQIGLSVKASDVKLVGISPDEALQKAAVEAKAGRMTEAERILSAASRANPGEESLTNATRNFPDIRQAHADAVKARVAATQAKDKIQQMRRNVAIVDRPDPLRPGDNSNHVRAEKLKREADDYENSTLEVS